MRLGSDSVTSLRAKPTLALALDRTFTPGAGRYAHCSAASGKRRCAPSTCACDWSSRAIQLVVVVRVNRLTNEVPYGRNSASAAVKRPVWPDVVADAPLIVRNEPGPPNPNWNDSGASTAAASSALRRLRVYETSIGENMRPTRASVLESAE